MRQATCFTCMAGLGGSVRCLGKGHLEGLGEGHQIGQANLAGREGSEPAASGAPVSWKDDNLPAARMVRRRTCDRGVT